MPDVAGKGQHAPLLVVADIEEFGLGQRLSRIVPDHEPIRMRKRPRRERSRLIL
ncbi:hypothetical protein D3C72_1938890 [compost metagenome]